MDKLKTEGKVSLSHALTSIVLKLLLWRWKIKIMSWKLVQWVHFKCLLFPLLSQKATDKCYSQPVREYTLPSWCPREWYICSLVVPDSAPGWSAGGGCFQWTALSWQAAVLAVHWEQIQLDWRCWLLMENQGIHIAGLSWNIYECLNDSNKKCLLTI